MDVDGNPNVTLDPYDGISKSTYIEERLNVGVNAKLIGVDKLVSSIKDWRHFKTLHMAWASIDFNCVNTSSFYNTTLLEPSWFDVLVFNSFNVS